MENPTTNFEPLTVNYPQLVQKMLSEAEAFTGSCMRQHNLDTARALRIVLSRLNVAAAAVNGQETLSLLRDSLDRMANALVVYCADHDEDLEENLG